jgi:hypothetical protein
MKLTEQDKTELIQAARLAQTEGDSLWDRIANYFKPGWEIVEPRNGRPERPD